MSQSPQLVTLRNGSQVSSDTVLTVSKALLDLRDQGIDGFCVLYDLVCICRDPLGYTPDQNNLEPMQQRGLMETDGSISKSVSDIVLSSAVGEGLEMKFFNPLADDI
jgi:hypothetical protein